MRLIGADAQVMQLHVRLGPREGDSALERGYVVMLVGLIEGIGAGRRDHCPESYSRCGAGRDADPSAQTEARVEHGADRIGKRAAVDYGNCGVSVAPAAKKARAVGFKLDIADW